MTIRTMLGRPVRAGACVAAALAFAGCAANSSPGPGGEALTEPDIVALSTYEAQLGTPIEIYGEGFVPPELGTSYLVFDGTFTADGGGAEPVDEVALELRYEDVGTMRWETFGPYRVPFGSSGDRTGVFEGDVWARTVLEDGTVLEDTEPLSTRFRVEPSLRLSEFQPVTATCAGPIKRALGGVPYTARVEAVGFEPVSFTYTMSIVSEHLDAPPVRIRHAAAGKLDELKGREDFRFPQVPHNMQYYTAQVTIAAEGDDGRVRKTSFAMGVHRPIEVFYNGNVEVAELFEPQPVSGCVPGGKVARKVTYRESTEETRTRSTSVSWSESFLRRHTVTSEESRTVQTSVTNSVGIGITEGNKVTWDVGGNPTSIHLGPLGQVGLESNINRSEANSREVENSRERTAGLTESETTTNSESLANEESVSSGGSIERTLSSSEVIGTDFEATVLPDQYGVFYRQTVRLLRRGLLVTYNLCGAAEVVGDYDVVDWTWSPDMAQGSQCPPFPESNLPDRECLIEPCAGG